MSCSGSITSTVWRSSVAKWPDIGATSSTRGWGPAPSLRKCSSVPNGVASAASSVTGRRRSPSITVSRPNGGRRCVMPASANSVSPATIWRSTGGVQAPQSNSPVSPAPRRAIARIGWSRSDCAW